MVLLTAAVIREGDILANPTNTHRPGATQVLTSSTHLSMQSILEHPIPLPMMTYHQEGDVLVAYPTFMPWPDGMNDYFEPMDMSFDSNARPFGYASVVAFLLAGIFALLGRSDGRRTDRI
jgi:hypothetical protein